MGGVSQIGLDFAPQRQVLSVSELTFAVRSMLEGAFADVRVSGEISNVRRPASGHYYFTLKDGQSQLKAVCFRQNALYLKVKPSDGLEVVARGRIGVYEQRGEYQLYVEAIEPQGYGALQLAFEQLKKKLALEGLFDDDRKRPLPPFPSRIGLVTSSTGAVVADMIRVMERRFPGLHIRVHPAKVQGEGAAEEIARGVRWFSENPWAHVVIVGRGGGSLEDLWAFNEEVVARAIVECAVPVISAVGHQTDFTIADFVADLRAPTPSAAAEMVVPDLSEVRAGVMALRDRSFRAMRYRFSQSGRRLVEAGVERPAGLLRRRIQRLWQTNDELEQRLGQAIVKRLRASERRFRDRQHRLAELDLRVRMAARRAQLTDLRQRLVSQVAQQLGAGRSRYALTAGRLDALSPVAILERGYSIVTDGHGTIVRDAGTLSVDDPLTLRLHRGRAEVRVEKAASSEEPR